jgi:hypothetical protein
MALSDREQRLLAEMEEALSADDPRLVSTLSGKSSKFTASIGLAIAALLTGFAILFAGLIAQLTLVGVGGFLVALVGVILLINTVTKNEAKFGQAGRSPKRARRSFTQGFTKGMEDRWDQRNNG